MAREAVALAPNFNETPPKPSRPPKPLGVCTRCRQTANTINQLNLQCDGMNGATRCTGILRATLRSDDWRECSACAGSESEHCTRCRGRGWIR